METHAQLGVFEVEREDCRRQINVSHIFLLCNDGNDKEVRISRHTTE